MAKMIHFRIKRQDKRNSPSYWEDFLVPYRPMMNVISALMAIQKNPVNSRNEKTTPVVWEDACLEEVCGSCTMVINGKVRQSCSALVDKLEQPITLEPMSKFPVIRDLIVDRNAMFDTLKKVKAWIEIDGTHNLGPGPKIDPKTQQKSYEFSRCMTCGCCLEACPQFNAHSDFIGASALGQVRLFNAHPTGKSTKDERLDAIMGPGGIVDCGNAQNCVESCPKDIPLTEAIGELGREVTRRSLRRIFEE